MKKISASEPMSWNFRFLLALVVAIVLVDGCASTHTYDFLVTNRDCNCSRYVLRDRQNRITYEFTATYSLDDNMLTTIALRVENRSHNVLSFDHARVRVASERFPYQYNNKFVPFEPVTVRPGGREEIVLVGRAAVGEKDEWYRIAGEKMTVTIRGVRLGEKELSLEDVKFVPVNPKLSSE